MASSIAHSLNDIARLVKPYRWRILAGLATLLTGTVFTLVFPAAIRVILDTAITSGNRNMLQMASIELLALMAARAFVAFYGEYVLESTGHYIVLDLRKKLFSHLQTLDLGFFHAHKTGNLLSKLNADTAEIKIAITGSLVNVVNQAFALIGSIAIMLSMNTQLTALILLLAPSTALLSRKYGPVMRAAAKDMQEKAADSSAIAQESLSGIAFIKSNAREKTQERIYDNSIAALGSATVASLRAKKSFQALITFLTSLLTVGIFWYGGMQVLANHITAGQLVAFLFYTQNITLALTITAQHYGNINQAAGASRQIFDLLKTRSTVAEKEAAISPTECRGEILFSDVRFAYGKGPDVLRGIQLHVAPGEIVALAGRSGSGKSTITYLLARLYDVSSGQVCIDGCDVRDLSLAWLRSHISIVSQDIFLFGSSVRENIRYGRLDATDHDVEQAAKIAAAHDFIEHLEHGYNTEIGERGVKLSGGQRQRLALARAVLNSPKILVLDEATSGVDNTTESAIKKVILKLSMVRKMTIIVIAHRLSTVRAAHRIVVLENGRIVEEGPPELLLRQGGKLSKLMEDGLLESEVEIIQSLER